MPKTQNKGRWLTAAESEERSFDTYGLIDETHFSLTYPREVDCTIPTLEGALKEATRMMLDDFATSITLTRVKHWEDPSGEIQTFENPAYVGTSVELFLNGDLQALQDLEDEEEAA
jgi:hypothetical protein